MDMADKFHQLSKTKALQNDVPLLFVSVTINLVIQLLFP